MLIAHISDFHILPAPALCYGYSDTRAGLTRAIAAIEAMQPRPDLVLATGDLVDEPSVEAYATLRAIMTGLSIPLLLLPGNHDDRGMLASAFPDHDYLAKDGAPAHYGVEHGGIRILGFDTAVPDKEFGDPTPESLDWLDAALSSAPDRPTMIAMHHPPIVTGLAFMDAIQPPWPPRLAAIVAAHPQVKLIACGHVHRLMDGMLGGARVASAGSTAHQFAFATDLDSLPRLSGEPAMIRLHLWQDGAVTSFATPVDRDFPVRAFGGMDEASWQRIRTDMLAGRRRPGGAAIEQA